MQVNGNVASPSDGFLFGFNEIHHTERPPSCEAPSDFSSVSTLESKTGSAIGMPILGFIRWTMRSMRWIYAVGLEVGEWHGEFINPGLPLL